MPEIHFREKSITQLTAPGNAETLDIGATRPVSAEIDIVVASIDTNVVVKMEYDTESTFTSAFVGISETITANGTYVIPIAIGYKYARLVFVSEAGGTAATIDATYRLNLR